ncbi:MAG: hypothetical protein AB8B66_04200 [Rickettsiaceae bacterium]
MKNKLTKEQKEDLPIIDEDKLEIEDSSEKEDIKYTIITDGFSG